MLKHLAIIPDGNRRYAKKNNLSLEEAYGLAIEKTGEIARWCKEEGIEELTLWGFSTENWKRSKEETRTFFGTLKAKANLALKSREAEKEVMENGVKVKIIGNTAKLPKAIRRLAKEIEGRTKHNNKRSMNILINYGGREEILNAVNLLLSEGKKKVTEAEFKKKLMLTSEPDLIIRTSGEQRTSGFLPFQSDYSELYFSKKLFPEFGKKDFKIAIEEFRQRKRRFGE
jgi:undecaprenyl diphosphate synthase